MGLLKFFGNKKSIVIDVISLYEVLGVKGDVSPRTQLQILRRLTRFADRESINMIAILGGKPLHKAPNKKKFDNICYFFLFFLLKPFQLDRIGFVQIKLAKK